MREAFFVTGLELARRPRNEKKAEKAKLSKGFDSLLGTPLAHERTS
jgi:hypothetical protein